jgi:endonuclease/exonuclease/phosphatase family metal-dependent hydrolase
VRVATFNVQHGLPASGGPVSAATLAAAIAELDADVLALQEVDRGVPRSGGHDLLAIAAEAMGASAHAWGPTLRFRRGEYGNALLVRGEIDALVALDLPRIVDGERRGALVARATVDEATLSVAATHLSVDPPEAVEQLAVVCAALLARSGPHVLLGDLNLMAPVVPPPLTVLPGRHTHPAGEPRRRIDHVVVAGIAPTVTTTVRTPVSDHRAVVADLVPWA